MRTKGVIVLNHRAIVMFLIPKIEIQVVWYWITLVTKYRVWFGGNERYSCIFSPKQKKLISSFEIKANSIFSFFQNINNVLLKWFNSDLKPIFDHFPQMKDTCPLSWLENVYNNTIWVVDYGYLFYSYCSSFSWISATHCNFQEA